MVEKIKDPEHNPKINGIMFDKLNNAREDYVIKIQKNMERMRKKAQIMFEEVIQYLDRI